MINVRKISPELAILAEKELNEDPNRIEQDMKILKEWISQQRHLTANPDEQWLIAFLRGCKYSLERTKEKIDVYYAYRCLFPNICMPCDPLDPEMQELMNIGLYVPIFDTSNPTSPCIVISRYKYYDPDKISFEKVINVAITFSNMLMYDDQATIAGHINIIDLEGCSMKLISMLNVTNFKKFTLISQSYPARIKGDHLVNMPSFAEPLMNFYKTFAPKKIVERFHTHPQGIESLHKYVPKSILPTEYGGDAGPIQNMIDAWKKKMEDRRDLILDDMKYGSDESKRIGKLKYAEEFHGPEGTFRQLQVD